MIFSRVVARRVVFAAALAAGCGPNSSTSPSKEPSDEVEDAGGLGASGERDARTTMTGKADAASSVQTLDGATSGGGVDAQVDTNVSTEQVDAAPSFSPSDAGLVAAAPLTGTAVKRRGDDPAGAKFRDLPASSGPIVVGAMSNGVNGFTGLIDRVRVYKIAISDDDVKAHAAGKLEPCGVSPECVGDWTWDNEKNGTVPSTGPLPLDAKLMKGAKLVPGREGLSLKIELDGKNALGWAEVASDPKLALGQEVTVEAWVLFDNACSKTAEKCFINTMVTYLPSFDFEVHGGGLVLRSSGPGAIGGAGDWPAGQKWTHVAVTFTKQQVRIFKDGVRTWPRS